MRRTSTSRIILIVVSILLWQGAAVASTADLKQSIQRLNDWLGDNPQGDSWRSYLKLEPIESALAAEAAPVRLDIAKSLERFESDASGLDLWPFVLAREALRRHAHEIKLTKEERELTRMAEDASSPPSIDASLRAQAKSEVINSLMDLQNYLVRGGYEVEQGWKSHLGWNDLMNELNSSDPDPKLIGKIAGRFRNGDVGLERPSFVRVREALLVYRRLLLEEAELEKLYAAQLKMLAKNIGEAAEVPNISKLTEINTRVNWLDDLGQAGGVLSKIRARYQQPNISIRVSEALVARGLTDQVNQNTPISDTILGVRIRGNAKTSATVTADVLPGDDGAAVSLVLTGITNSRTVGNRSPVRIFSHSRTQVLGRKTVRLTENGLTTEPATANCRTNTNIQSIQSTRRLGGRIIEKIARGRAESQKSASERIASQRANARVTQMMDEQAAERIAAANQKMRAFTPRLAARNVHPEWIKFRSTHDEVQITAKQGLKHQFGASSKPPQMPKFNICVQIHETMAANTAINYMAGLTLTDKMAADLAKDAMDKVPSELELKDDEDPWSITFDRQNPVVLRFDDQQINVAIRGRKFTRGEQELSRLMEISANYRAFVVDGRAELVRQGDIIVEFPNRKGKRLAIGEIPYRDLMKNKFSGLFREQIESRGLPIPDDYAQLGDLRLQYVSSEDGWLSLGWN